MLDHRVANGKCRAAPGVSLVYDLVDRPGGIEEIILRFGVDRNGEQLLDRYIAWADVRLTNGRTLRVMSLHMPPQRFEYLQPIMADNLAAFVEQTPHKIVIGGDWNFQVNNDPHDIFGLTGLVPRGVGSMASNIRQTCLLSSP